MVSSPISNLVNTMFSSVLVSRTATLSRLTQTATLFEIYVRNGFVQNRLVYGNRVPELRLRESQHFLLCFRNILKKNCGHGCLCFEDKVKIAFQTDCIKKQKQE